MATGARRREERVRRQGGGDDGALQPQQQDGGQEALARGPAQGAELEESGRGQGLLKNVNEVELARGLGWFSIGLGAAEVLAPQGIAKVAGVRGDNSTLIRLLGLREIAHGVSILSQRRPHAATLWARVAGDVIDLACLGAAFASPDSDKARLTFATMNVLGVSALDVLCAQQLGRERGRAPLRGSSRATKSIIVNRAPEEVYQFWRDFENLPRFMHHLESVRVTGEGRSHWVATAPAGTTVGWDAEIAEDRPNELIAWRSLEGADVYNEGAVRFEPATGNRGTVVHVEIDYTPPGGLVGTVVAMLFGEEPEQQLQGDLRRLKQVLETGEVVLSEATLPGTGLTEQRPAQPRARAAAQ